MEIVRQSFSKTTTALLKYDMTDTLTTCKESNVANESKNTAQAVERRIQKKT